MARETALCQMVTKQVRWAQKESRNKSLESVDSRLNFVVGMIRVVSEHIGYAVGQDPYQIADVSKALRS